MPITPEEARRRREALEYTRLDKARKEIDSQLAECWKKDWLWVQTGFRFETNCLELLKDSYKREGWAVRAQLGRGMNYNSTHLYLRPRTWWDSFCDYFRWRKRCR